MIFFLIAVVIVIVGVVAALVLGRTGGMSMPMAEATSSVGGMELPIDVPPGHLHAEALSEVRFDRAVRGYRMDQVDAVLDRLREELAERDQRASVAQLPEAYQVPYSAPFPQDPPQPFPQGHPEPFPERSDG